MGGRTQVQIPVEAMKGNVAPTIAAEQPQINATNATIRVTVHNNGGTESTSVTDQNLNAAALQAVDATDNYGSVRRLARFVDRSDGVAAVLGNGEQIAAVLSLIHILARMVETARKEEHYPGFALFRYNSGFQP